MPAYLVFRLYGPMCSWGEIAVGESRHTADHPSRSALLGLFAAALGLERGEEAAQQALSDALQFGVKLLSPGMLLRDFHSVQSPKRESKVIHRTRRSELHAPVVNTLLSHREYRTDSVSVVAAELKQAAKWALPALQFALERPCFPLYLGRKSCPPALPLAPRIVEAPSLRAALDAGQLALAGLRRQPSKQGADEPVPHWPAVDDQRTFRLGQVHYFWEDGMQLDEVGADTHTAPVEFIRNDQPLSRARWQFARRREWASLEDLPISRKGAL